MYGRKLICSKKTKNDSETIYNYCSIPKKNCSSLILIIFINGNKNFNIKQNSEDISSYSIILYYSSKKLQFDNMKYSQLIAIGSPNLIETFLFENYIKFIL